MTAVVRQTKSDVAVGVWMVLPAISLIGIAALHRFGLHAWAGAAACAALVLTAVLVRARPGTRVLATGIALVTVGIAGLHFMADGRWWPCPVACQGGAFYQQLFGVPAPLWAIAGLALVTGCAWWGRWSWAQAVVWCLAGGSAFYLWIAWRLGLSCSYCWAVHSGIALCAVASCRSGIGWRIPSFGLAAGFALLLGIYGPGLRVDAPAPVSPVASARRTAFAQAPEGVADPGSVAGRIDLGRRLGQPDAPLVAEVVIDVRCPHCALVFAPLLTALDGALAAGRVEVLIRCMVRDSDPASREVVGHLLATGLTGSFRTASSAVLEAGGAGGWDAVQERLRGKLDPAVMASAYRAAAPELAGVIERDLDRLALLGCRTTPLVVLWRRSGAEVARWSGSDVESETVAAVVALMSEAKAAKP